MTAEKTQQPEGPLVPDALEEKLSELKILQESFQEAKKKADSYYDQLVRLAADFENYRKRSEQRIEQARLAGKEEALETLLSFSDTLQHALHSLTPRTPADQVIEGLKILMGDMDKMLRGIGVEKIKTEDQMFDPHLHEAVDRIPSDKPEGTILEEVQRGYTLNGRLLRHARVRVAAPH